MKALELRETMKPTYLVQRLEKGRGGKHDNPFTFGGGFQNGGFSKEFMDVIRPIFAFDYMGAAEFEFGAVPEAMQFLFNEAQKKGLEGGIVGVGGARYPVYIIAPSTYITEAADRIKKMFTGQSLRLKEPTLLRQALEDPNFHIKGWIELDNGFMFFADKDMWLDVCKLFGLGEGK